MLRTEGESRSLRRTLHAESGEAVLALGISYGAGGILLEVSPIDRAYVESHVDETEEAVAEFLEAADLLLEKAGMPRILRTER